MAREFGLSVTQIQAALDRALPAFDAKNQLLAFKRELHRLQDLSDEFFVIAKRDKDHESAHLVARLNERIAAMRGWTSINIRMDPYTVQSEAQPSRHERIKEAIMRLTNDQPPARREAVNLIDKLGHERALELLKAGSGNGHDNGSGGDASSDPDPDPAAS